MGIDAKKILEELDKNEPKRQRTSLYLNSFLYEEFRASCAPHSPSRVIEELMREFLTSHLQNLVMPKKKKTGS
jgi:hypothetical protein